MGEVHTIEDLALAMGCAPRTLMRWRKVPGCPRIEKDESVEAWVARMREWELTRPRRRGRVVVDPTAKKAGVDWIARGQRALAEMRIHNLAVLRGKYLERKVVHEEWRARVHEVSRRLLALPRQLANMVPVALAEQIERDADEIVRQALASFTTPSPATPSQEAAP